MATFKVVGIDVFPYCSPGFFDVGVFCKVCLFVLEAPEPAFDHDVVGPPAFAIHTLTDAVAADEVDILIACELTALIRIDDQRLGHLKGFFACIDYHSGVQSQPTIQRLYQSIMAVR